MMELLVDMIAMNAVRDWKKEDSFKEFLMTLDEVKRNVVVILCMDEQVMGNGWLQWIESGQVEAHAELLYALEQLNSHEARRAYSISSKVQQLKGQPSNERNNNELASAYRSYRKVRDKLITQLEEYTQKQMTR
jgi:capsid portal protein